MDNKQKQLIAYSWHHASQNPKTLGENFYRNLFENAPQLQALFPQNMDAQQQKLMDSISTLILGLDELENMQESLTDLGQKHTFIYQAEPEHYLLFGETLLQTLAEAAGSHWSEEIQSAWQSLFQLITEKMLKN